MKRHVTVAVGIACLIVLGGGVWWALSRGAAGPAEPEPRPPEAPRPPAEQGLEPTAGGQEEARLGADEGEGEAETPGEHPRFGSWEDRISRVTEDLGLTADISDCKVTVDGKPLEGKKLFAALAEGLFVNEYQIYPPLKGLPVQVYCGAVPDEALLIFRQSLRQEPRNPDAAMERAMEFASSMPWVEKVDRAAWEILVYYDRALLEIVLVGSHFDTGPDPSGPETRHLQQRKERGIVNKFHEIVKALHGGASLVIDTQTGYSLQD